MPADVDVVEGRAIEWADGYLRDTYKSAPPAARDALERLGTGQPIDPSPEVRRWLSKRYLLTSDDRLAVPLFAAWLAHHALA